MSLALPAVLRADAGSPELGGDTHRSVASFAGPGSEPVLAAADGPQRVVLTDRRHRNEVRTLVLAAMLTVALTAIGSSARRWMVPMVRWTQAVVAGAHVRTRRGPPVVALV